MTHALWLVWKRRKCGHSEIGSGVFFIDAGAEKAIVPALWSQGTFARKTGGGAYCEGAGFGIGAERLVLALTAQGLV